ncbi:hypothetical protein ACRAWC_20735 [Leifsonia sp. L25]|uniref:hypothetical protein n=1 Tax=Leifsonia sp. L25 TaxID=3423957 RepID=UPI003D69943C
MLNSDTASRPAVRPGAMSPERVRVRWSRARWLLLLATCIVIALDGLDVSMVGVALPSIGKELGLDTGSLQWIVSRLRPRLRQPPAARRPARRPARPAHRAPGRARRLHSSPLSPADSRPTRACSSPAAS